MTHQVAWLARLAAFLVTLIAGDQALAQDAPSATSNRAWGAYLAVTATRCGVRDAQWGQTLPRAMLAEAGNAPSRWGIPTRSTMGMRLPELNALNAAKGAVAMALTIGELLHARMAAPACAEARRAASTMDALARSDPRDFVVTPLPAPVPDAATLIFVATLAAERCRARQPRWLRDALPQILARFQEAQALAPTEQPQRRIALAQINGAEAFAHDAPAIAYLVFGAAICRSVTGWPELRQADAAAAEGARMRTRPGGIWRDVVPIE